MTGSIQDMCAQFIREKRLADKHGSEANKLKVAIREAVRVAGPDAFDTDGKTSFINVDKRAVSVTRTDPKQPPVLPEVLRGLIGDEAFHDVCTVTAIDVDVAAWLQAVKNERVTQQNMLDSLGEEPAPVAWAVKVVAARSA